MNRLQFEQAVERFAETLMESIDADATQVRAWQTEGHDLIHAFTEAEFTSHTTIAGATAEQPFGPTRVIRQSLGTGAQARTSPLLAEDFAEVRHHLEAGETWRVAVAESRRDGYSVSKSSPRHPDGKCDAPACPCQS
jgi:hypothetical protein